MSCPNNPALLFIRSIHDAGVSTFLWPLSVVRHLPRHLTQNLIWRVVCAQYVLVTNEFGRTMSRAVIGLVQRIENKPMHDRFIQRRKELKKEMGR